MDEDIRTAIGDLKSDLNRRFDQVDRSIETMVTKSEFNATVQRIDAEANMLRRDFESHEKEAPSHRAAAAAKAESVRAEVKAELEGFRVTTRWAIGLAAGGAGIVFAVIQWVFSLITK
ncbi:hypothetical protein ACI7YT_12255 [Microbacterium sp. M]|uniref:hypothetical protein n=1 Tax=Microbacterium sp. M TaxID=3377125 RepID=UPI003867F0FF